ncbi:MAG: UTRA domain-containing protein [Bacteroidetes bacterium]|jgi:GntR family transcriptional regulator|nr:UTRA domain-containing protein [Bacteroidota bacterium]
MDTPGAPRHEQISDWLRARIEQGQYEPNDKLPSENDLCEQFDVSRITVRRALQTLETEGHLYRRQGLGSFVQDARLHQGLAYLTDFVQDMEQRGIAPSCTVVHRAPEPASPDVAAFLGVEPETTVVRIDRVRQANADPVAFDQTWLPPTYAELLADSPLTEQTIFQVLEHAYAIPVVKGECRIGATQADEDVAAHLHLAPGAALLLMERVSFAEDQSCIFYQTRYYRADRMSFNLHLARDAGTPAGGDGALPVREFESVLRGSAE